MIKTSALPLVTNILFSLIGSAGSDLIIRKYFPFNRTLARRIITTCGLIPTMVLFAVVTGLTDIGGSLFIGLIVAAYGSLAFAIVCRDPGTFVFI